jgi:hypothetical protein
MEGTLSQKQAYRQLLSDIDIQQVLHYFSEHRDILPFDPLDFIYQYEDVRTLEEKKLNHKSQQN